MGIGLISGYGSHGGMHTDSRAAGFLFVFVAAVVLLIALQVQYWLQARKIKSRREGGHDGSSAGRAKETKLAEIELLCGTGGKLPWESS